MDSGRSVSVRFEDDPETEESPKSQGDQDLKQNYTKKAKHILGWLIKPEKHAIGKSSKGRELSRVFSEDYEVVEKTIFDPRGHVVTRWNKVFFVACLVSLFVDPLFFYLLGSTDEMCISVSIPVEEYLTIVRSMLDVFYVIQLFVRFRTTYVAPSSRVFGRGELVIDTSKIASRYLHRDFWLDLLAAQPVHQVLIWIAIPHLTGATVINSRNVIRFVVIFQLLLRLYLIFPLWSQITKVTGHVIETAWAGAAYNLMLFMLASHILGACWFLFAIERIEDCLTRACSLEPECQYGYLRCMSVGDIDRISWFKSSNISKLCDPRDGFLAFGIYGDALTYQVTSSKFFNKYFYCLWWGLRNLSSLGQNLSTSTYKGEIIFAIVIAILGLVLFALLIGNMQTYLQSTTMRLEEWRIRRTDTEEWMRHRQLPRELKHSVRRHDQYKWLATRGVDEETILKGLPLDLRRDIKHHLCLDLVRQVPLFDEMDEMMLDAICERLKPALCTPGTCLVREGDPVNEMLFIVRGHLDSCTTNGGRTGFFNSSQIGPGDFCGEELLTWALDPRLSAALPLSTRTVKAITEVEAFALIAEDLKFVASQFRRLKSKQLRHTFRFYSHQWRTWAACFIQAAWFRYKRRKEAAELKAHERLMISSPVPRNEHFSAPLLMPSGFRTFTANQAASARRGGSRRFGSEFEILGTLQKPVDPDFTVDER